MGKKERTSRGAVMVEASIYFPIVIGVVMLMLYVGLFQMEESALGYVAERVAVEVSREEAYPGYTEFQMNEGRAVDFAWDGKMPSVGEVHSYYKAHHADLGKLYREFGAIASLFGGGGSTDGYRAKYADTANAFKIISLGTVHEPEVMIKRGLFSSSVTVTITHEFPVPGILRYLGISETQYDLTTTATKNIVNAGEFVRNVDLAVDAAEYLLEKLGLSGNVKQLITKAKDVMNKIL